MNRGQAMGWQSDVWQAQGRGKIILLGEHSVVYGRPALAAGLTHGARARVVETDGEGWLEVHPWQVRVSPTTPESSADLEQLRLAFAAIYDGPYLSDSDGHRKPLGVQAEVSLPTGAGLGSSAALGVAVVRALDHAAGKQRDVQAVAEACIPWERVFHGNPSGVDTAMAAAGGVAVFRRGHGIEALQVPQSLTWVIGYSGKPGSTKETVAHVAAQHAQDAARLEQVFDEIASLVLTARMYVETGALSSLGALLDRNHTLLVSLGLSTLELDQMCAAARTAGALGAKLTGGGGGGCMIALAASESAAEPIAHALSNLGYETFVTQIERTEIE